MNVKHEVLQEYRELMCQLEEENGTLSQVQAGGDMSMLNMLQQVEELYKRGGEMAPKVIEVDSCAVASMSSSVQRRVGGMDTAVVTFHPLEFAARLVAQAPDSGDTPSPAFWATLGGLVSPWFAPMPRLRFLHGTLPQRDVPPPVKKPRTPREKLDPRSEATKPELVAAKASQPENTRHQVTRMYKILRKRASRCEGGCVPFFDFAYHPSSFSATVENVFHLAILVRERMAEVLLDAEGLPVVRALEDNSSGAQAAPAGDTVCRQLLLKLDYGSWQKVIKTFEIKTPMITEKRKTPSDGEKGSQEITPKRKH